MKARFSEPERPVALARSSGAASDRGGIGSKPNGKREYCTRILTIVPVLNLLAKVTWFERDAKRANR